MTALLMPVLMAAAGLASDAIHASWLHRTLQRQANTAALAGADALSQNRAVAETVEAKLSSNGGLALSSIELAPLSGPFTGDPVVVHVRLTTIARPPFAGLFSPDGVPIRAEARAGLMMSG